MKSFVAWNDALSIGIEDIDDQHKGLIALINDVWKALMSHAAAQNIESIVLDLDDYTCTHFKEEEALQERYGYPGLEAHKESHAFFIGKVKELDARIAAGEIIGLELLEFLSDWLTYHISIVDRQYADFIRSHEG
ncbi:MAG: bacteriohemerythrin [Rhodocyclaceae bacterium]|nr:bacteriohemerythrin [Rhodocyclaceae bacterium]